jgi:transcription-repair coupling factor (superfamily II helicase)
LQAQLPEDYVPESGLRLRLYRRLADIQMNAQIEEIAKELQDRFGKPPEQVENLLYLLSVKVAAIQARLASIAVEDGRIVIKYGREDEALSARLTKQFKIRAGRDRAWLPGPAADTAWREKLTLVMRAVAKDA